MADFKSKTEQKKWDALDGTSKTPFDKLIKGTATDSDVKKLTELAATYGELAKTIFQEGLIAIEERADWLVQQAEEKRLAAGKGEMNPDQVDKLYGASKKRAMKELSPELIETVEETLLDKIEDLKSSIEENQDEVKKTLSKQDKTAKKKYEEDSELKKLLKKLGKKDSSEDDDDDDFDFDDYDNPTGTKGVRATEKARLQAEYQKTIKGHLGTFLNGKHLKRKKHEWDRDEKVDNKLAKLLTTLVGSKTTENLDSNKRDFYSVGETSATTFGFSEKTDAAFLKAFRSGETTNKDLDAYVKKYYTSPRAKAEAKHKDSSDSWLDKIKGLLSKGKSVAKGVSSGWVGTLLKGLGLLLLSPELLKTVTDKVSQFFSLKTITDMYDATITKIKDVGSSLVSGVVDKIKDVFHIGKDKPRKEGEIKPIKGLAPDTSGAASTGAPTNDPTLTRLKNKKTLAETNLAKAKAVVAGYTAKGQTAPSKALQDVSVWQQAVNDTSNEINSYSSSSTKPTSNLSVTNNSPTSPAGLVPPKSNSSLPIISDAAFDEAEKNQSYGDSSPMSYLPVSTMGQSMGSTKVMAEASAPFTPGTVMGTKASMEPAMNNFGQASKNNNASVAPITLSTFGISSATSDLLSIINHSTLTK